MVELADRLDADPELRMVPYFFTELYGRRPAGVWRVPGALPLLREVSRDTGAAWLREVSLRRGTSRNETVRSLAVPLRWGAIIAAEPRADGVIELRSMNRPAERALDSDASIPDWAGGILAVVKELRLAGHPVGGVTLLAHTDVPQSGGIGAATALSAAAGLAFNELFQLGLSRADLADLIGGFAAASLGGRPAHAFLQDEESSCVGFDLEAAGLRLLIVAPRQPGTGDGTGSDPTGLVEEAVGRLSNGDPAGLGPLLTAAHAVRPMLGSGEAEEVAFGAALEGGALGARAISDGSGSALVALVRVDDLHEVRASITSAFAVNDLRCPRLLTAVAAVRGD